MNWYSIRVHAGRENITKDHILTMIEKLKLGDFFGEVLVPVKKVLKDSSGYRRKEKINLCPGYIFIQMEMSGETIRFIKQISNTYSFVSGSDRKPTIIGEDEIDKMRDAVISEKFDITDDNFKIGSKVKVIEGPFLGFEGELFELDKGRCKVNVPVFGRITPIEIEKNKLEVVL